MSREKDEYSHSEDRIVDDLQSQLSEERKKRLEAEKVIQKLKGKQPEEVDRNKRKFLRTLKYGSATVGLGLLALAANHYYSFLPKPISTPSSTITQTSALPTIGQSIIDFQGFEDYMLGPLGKSIYSDQVFSGSSIVSKPVNSGQKSLMIEKEGDGFYRDFGAGEINKDPKNIPIKKGTILEFCKYLDPNDNEWVSLWLQLYLTGDYTHRDRYLAIIKMSSEKRSGISMYPNWPGIPVPSEEDYYKERQFIGEQDYYGENIRKWEGIGMDLNNLLETAKKGRDVDLWLNGYMLTLVKSSKNAGVVYVDDITVKQL